MKLIGCENIHSDSIPYHPEVGKNLSNSYSFPEILQYGGRGGYKIHANFPQNAQ